MTARKNMERLLLIDDEPDFLSGLARLIQREFSQLAVDTATSASQALTLLDDHGADLVFLDIRMPEMDGLTLLANILGRDPELAVVMLTAHGTIDTAVTAMKKGAWDFLTKPVDRAALCAVINRGLERCRLQRENRALKQRLAGKDGFLGSSPPIRRLLAELENAAATDYNVLVRGESGTGKELAARAIHRLSARRDGPLVTVNLPAIPEHLLESELFGHQRGAFTGADRDHRGLFVAAHGGTLILDEIGDIPPAVQTKLLRVLEEQEVRPLGTTRSVPVDVRVVAVTNQDLEARVRDRTFRQDLYYRLNVLTIHTPRLADIRDDIPELANHFLRRAAAETGRQPPELDGAFLAALAARPWPGNVRELKNTMRRYLVTGSLDLAVPAGNATAADLPYHTARQQLLDDFHRAYFTALLQKTAGNVSQAAAQAGVNRTALQKILRRAGLDPAAFRPTCRP